MTSPAINFRVLLLAIIPTTAVSIFLFSYFVNQQIKEIETNIIDKGETLTTHLASASEYGIFSGNLSILDPLTDSVLSNADVVSVTITDNQGTPIIQKFKNDAQQTADNTVTDSHNRVFSQPVIQHAVEISDFESDTNTLPPIIGWVTVEVSNDTAVQHKQDAILQTLSVTLFILLSSIFLATRVSRNITEPITELTTAVNEIENGNLNVSIEAHSTGAILTLEKGVRSMLKSIKSSQWEAQNKIDNATKDLRKSLELLEKQNEELLIARQEALSASQAKSAFLANISHEIRTPMNGILGFVKLLKDSNPSDTQTEYLFTIEQSANNLLAIINDILDLSKIEAGKLIINQTPFNLEECIEDVLSLTAPSAYEKDLELCSLFYDDTPKELIGAVDRVRQILINLISNAIKFSSSGTIMVRVMLESQKENKRLIKITTTDQGQGISEKDKNLLFKSFSQLDTSNTRQFGGTGLGLAISKSLVEAMNGKIGVESRTGEGSTFWFTFECELSDSEQSANVVTPSHLNKSVLLYDQNELTQMSLGHAFRHQGFEVKTCLDMEDLLPSDKQSTTPDIYAISVNQNEAQGTKIRKYLELLRNSCGAKILTLVSSSDPQIHSDLIQWGANESLSKPFRRMDFEKKLCQLFQVENKEATQNTYSDNNKGNNAKLGGLNVLVAEDNPINAKLVKTILQEAGAQTTVVDNGRKAIDTLKHDHFDVILMDIHMPEMNGIDAAKEIRRTEDPNSRIAIIGLTAASNDKDERFDDDSDFNEILEKPIAVDELLHEIAYWSHTRGSRPHHSQKNVPQQKNALGVDRSLSATLNTMLLRELPECKKKLQTAFDTQDIQFLRSEIHRLLGGMAYCDFTRLHKLTEQFQSSLKAQGSTMQEDFEAMLTEIDRLLGEDNNP